MYSFAQLLSGAPSGLYQLNGDWRSRSMDRLCRRKDIQLLRIDGDTVDSKRRFLMVAARAMWFPEGFGANWDAFADFATDLSWAPASGYVIVLGAMRRFEQRAPRALRTALGILEQAAQFWSEQRVPFHVLVAAEGDVASNGLPVVRAP